MRAFEAIFSTDPPQTGSTLRMITSRLFVYPTGWRTVLGTPTRCAHQYTNMVRPDRRLCHAHRLRAVDALGGLVIVALAACLVGGEEVDSDVGLAGRGEDRLRVLATVDGVPIHRGEVRQELRAVLHGRRPEAADEMRLEREMLRQIVRRRLALAALAADGRAVDDAQVERALTSRWKQFQERGTSLKAYLKEHGISEESYRARVRWELSWAACKADLLTEENLRSFFDRHRRHFDGTEVRASHVLLNVPAGSDDRSVDSVLERAREIRAAIEAGEVTFAEAAAKHSTAPSRDRGGDIGYFPRRGVMHERFSAAAFRLDPGEVSPPVVTPFGVHLIRVTDEKPGTKSFNEVQTAVYQAAEARLFNRLVTAGRQHARVEYAEHGNADN